METPSVRSRRVARVTKLFEELGAFAVFAAALDALGGGPQVFSVGLVVGAAASFTLTRLSLVVQTSVWMGRYIGSVGRRDAAIGVIWSVSLIGGIAAASVAWYILAMAEGFASVAYITTAAVIAAKLATGYEFTVNDETIVSG